MGKYSHLKGKLTQYVNDDASWVERVDARRKELLEDQPTSETLCGLLMDAKTEKAKLEETKTSLSCSIEAIEKILVERMEDQGLKQIKTSRGTFSIKDEPIVQFADKAAFHAWIRDTGQEDLFSVNPRTAEGIVKNMVLEGKEPPPGSKIYMDIGIATLKSKEHE